MIRIAPFEALAQELELVVRAALDFVDAALCGLTHRNGESRAWTRHKWMSVVAMVEEVVRLLIKTRRTPAFLMPLVYATSAGLLCGGWL